MTRVLKAEVSVKAEAWLSYMAALSGTLTDGSAIWFEEGEEGRSLFCLLYDTDVYDEACAVEMVRSFQEEMNGFIPIAEARVFHGDGTEVTA